MQTGSMMAAMPPNTTEPVNAYITPNATLMWSSTWLVVFAANNMGVRIAGGYPAGQLVAPMVMIATPSARSAIPAASSRDRRSRKKRRDTA